VLIMPIPSDTIHDAHHTTSKLHGCRQRAIV
jgi:hypothetical protein